MSALQRLRVQSEGGARAGEHHAEQGEGERQPGRQRGGTGAMGGGRGGDQHRQEWQHARRQGGQAARRKRDAVGSEAEFHGPPQRALSSCAAIAPGAVWAVERETSRAPLNTMSVLWYCTLKRRTASFCLSKSTR